MLPSGVPGRIALDGGDGGVGAQALDRLIDVAPENEMGPLGTVVAGHHRKSARKLALHIEIPRLKIGVAETRVDSYGRKSGGLSEVDRVLEQNRAGEGERHGQRRVAGCSRHYTRHGLVHQNSVRATHRSLSVLNGSQANPTRG